MKVLRLFRLFVVLASLSSVAMGAGAEEMTPNKRLLDAASRGNLTDVKAALQKGADVNTADEEGFTPLHYAALEGNYSLARYLIEQKGAALNAEDLNRATPLYVARTFGHRDVVRYLLKQGGEQSKSVSLLKEIRDLERDEGVNAVRDYFAGTGWTFLHAASVHGDIEAVQYLVEKQKVKVNAADSEGWTSLHVAVSESKHDVVSYLLGKGADLLAKATFEGRQLTPRQLAQALGHTKIADLLRPGIIDRAKSPKFFVLALFVAALAVWAEKRHSVFSRLKGWVKRRLGYEDRAAEEFEEEDDFDEDEELDDPSTQLRVSDDESFESDEALRDALPSG